MRVGFSLASVHLVDDHALGAKNIIAQARAANDAGLDYLTIGDRHSVGAPYYQNVPMIGRLMTEWDPARPVGCLFLLPLWHPVIAAEQIGTLATMSDAPFIVQIGVGNDAAQFAAMGRTLAERGDDTDELLRMLKALLAGAPVDSDRFGIEGATVSPLPPHGIDLWIGGGVPRGLRRAAEHGDAWYGDAHLTPTSAAELRTSYLQQCEIAGSTPRSIVRKDVLILRDGDRATRLGDDMIERGYRGMERAGVAYGGVDSVIEQLGAFAEIGFDDVVLRCMMVDQADALETIDLSAEVKAALGSE